MTYLITSHQMPKRCLPITPSVTFSENFRSVKLADVLSQMVIQLMDVQPLNCLMSLRLMHCHIEDAEMQLSEVE